MALLDRLIPTARQWQKNAQKAGEVISRAASLQAWQYRIHSPVEEARRLAALYCIHYKQRDWRDYGDIAFHLIAAYPSDLAFVILYAFRDMQYELGYDPVPYILKATEEMFHFRPENVVLHIEMSEIPRALLTNPSERAKRAAKLIAREISCTPLQWASGIFDAMDPAMKPFVADELRSFNPEAMDILSRGSRMWILTGLGFLHFLKRLITFLIRLLFGEDHI